MLRLSLEEAAGFTRDAFGRQSMSEKRHATLDAKHTDTYQRNKKLRLVCLCIFQIQVQIWNFMWNSSTYCLVWTNQNDLMNFSTDWQY